MTRDHPICAVLDACVLYPAALRDVLLSAADESLFRPVWSDEILAETDRALARSPRALTSEQRARLINAVRRTFPDATVRIASWPGPVPRLPDPHDEHVVRCALAADARLIVTMNLRDFPDPHLHPSGLAAVHPDRFLCTLAAWEPATLDRLVTEAALRMTHPPRSRDDFLDALERTVPRFAALMRGDLGEG